MCSLPCIDSCVLSALLGAIRIQCIIKQYNRSQSILIVLAVKKIMEYSFILFLLTFCLLMKGLICYISSIKYLKNHTMFAFFLCSERMMPSTIYGFSIILLFKIGPILFHYRAAGISRTEQTA